MGTKAKRCKECFAWEWEECDCNAGYFEDYVETRGYTGTSAYI